MEKREKKMNICKRDVIRCRRICHNVLLMSIRQRSKKAARCVSNDQTIVVTQREGATLRQVVVPTLYKKARVFTDFPPNKHWVI